METKSVTLLIVIIVFLFILGVFLFAVNLILTKLGKKETAIIIDIVGCVLSIVLGIIALGIGFDSVNTFFSKAQF